MSIPLIERAEQIDIENLSKMKLTSSQRNNVELIKEHLSSSFDYPRVLLGPKGGGKTVVARKVLNWYIQENQNSLPIMLVYKQNNRSEILDYNKLATPDQWGERRLKILQSSSPEELIKVSDSIFYDDYHWRFESVAKGKEDPEKFVKELKGILEESKKGKSVVFLSENPLGIYSEQVKINGLDEILADLGQFSYEKWLNTDPDKKIDYQHSINYAASSEISPPTYSEWENIFKAYGITAELPVKQILFRINQKPRAFVRFARIFSPKTEIEMNMIKEKALELLPEKVYSEKLDFYRFLMEIPFLRYNDIGSFQDFYFNEKVKKKRNVVESLHDNLPLIEDISKKYKVKTGKRIYYSPDKILHELLEELSPEKREEVENLIETCVDSWDAELKIGASKSLEIYESLTKKYPNSQNLRKNASSYFRRLVNDVSNIKPFSTQFSKYYISGQMQDSTESLVLYAPFKDAFGDVITETPTLEVLASRGKI